MPGRFEPFQVFLDSVQAAQVRHILCLLSDDEIRSRSPDYLSAILQDELPAQLWRFPISDFGIPGNPEELEGILDDLRAKLEQGESLVIHCAFGQGRTGMVATLLLARMGWRLEEAITLIRRAGSFPDTAPQLRFLVHRVEAWKQAP